MITVVTAVPGGGKTAWLVDLMIDMAAKGRPIFVHGIPDLLVPHFKLEDPTKWPDVVPDGAAVFVAEVQKFWRPRGPGQKVPPEVQAFETHRHRGLDFFLDTQGPKLLDSNIRDLVGRHVHFRDLGVLGRRWYEWPEVSQSLAWRTAPIRKRYVLPKRAFPLYKSASMHVKPIRSFPMAVVFGALAIAGASFFAWKSFGAVKSKLDGGASMAAAAPAASGAASGSGGKQTAAVARPRTALDYRRVSMPVVPNKPETAPMYDEVRKVQVMPRIMGGYCAGGECRCYIQYGLRAPIDPKACFEWVRDPPFDPYYAPPQPVQARQPAAPASGVASVS